MAITVWFALLVMLMGYGGMKSNLEFMFSPLAGFRYNAYSISGFALGLILFLLPLFYLIKSVVKALAAARQR